MHLKYRLSCAAVVELVDAQRSGRCGPRARAGSTPAFGTTIEYLAVTLAPADVTAFLYHMMQEGRRSDEPSETHTAQEGLPQMREVELSTKFA